MKASLDHTFLRQKKEAYQLEQRRKDRVQQKKEELALLQLKEQLSYPSYLNEILELELVHLYDHMIKMKNLTSRVERKSCVEKEVTFSEISHVVLEIKEAIVSQVRNSIPQSCKGIIFLLGGSGAGKSTALCYLRGDEFALKSDFHYESKSDRQTFIGHELSSSHTFFPNIEIVNELCIIDFPGFEDSHGPIVSIGIECALRLLIQEFNPKIILLEAITNIEGKFAALGHLANRLKRILKNKENCFLGLTKYSLDANYRKIKVIEETQEEQRLSPSDEESALQGQIQLLSTLIPQMSEKEAQEYTQQKIKKEAELASLQKVRLEALGKPFPPSKEKEESAKAIAKVEEEMLAQTGLKSIIRFSDLEDQVSLMKCLALLEKPMQEKTCLNPHLHFDADDKRLLDEKFEQELMPKLNDKSYGSVDLKDAQILNRTVLDSSLINAITKDYPEISLFLHSSEVDPTLVKEFDKKIVGSFIKKYMEGVISGLNIAMVKKMLNTYRATIGESLYSQTVKSVYDLRNYVAGLLGRPMSENEAEADKQWEIFQGQHQGARQTIEKDLDLPTWAKVFLSLPVGIPYGIYYLWKRYQTNSLLDSKIKQEIENYNELINGIKTTLDQLKRLERMIEKRVIIDDKFHSMPILLTSLDSIHQTVQNKIESIRLLYGKNEWDTRLDELVALFSQDQSKEIKDLSQFIVYIVASIFDSDIEWQVTPKEKSSTITFSWETLSPKLFSDEELPSHSKDGTYLTVLKRKNSQESCLLGESNSILSLIESWNLHILPRALEIVEVKTPLTLALLGAVLLKKWEPKK